jgi:hypothetical protein
MRAEEIEAEIEKLKQRKIELTSRINLTADFNEREELDREIERIDKQIAVLERFKNS